VQPRRQVQPLILLSRGAPTHKTALSSSLVVRALLPIIVGGFPSLTQCARAGPPDRERPSESAQDTTATRAAARRTTATDQAFVWLAFGVVVDRLGCAGTVFVAAVDPERFVVIVVVVVELRWYGNSVIGQVVRTGRDMRRTQLVPRGDKVVLVLCQVGIPARRVVRDFESGDESVLGLVRVESGEEGRARGREAVSVRGGPGRERDEDGALLAAGRGVGQPSFSLCKTKR
jgi:hypothetical protein